MNAARGSSWRTVLAVAVVAVLLLGATARSTYKLLFENAGQLVKDDDVQVGGRRIGSVRKIDRPDRRQPGRDHDLGARSGYAPLHEGTTAVVRATSLSGIANRYVALTPGPDSNRTLPEGATLGTDKTTSIVDLDQLFNTFDPKTRAALQQFIQGNAQWYDNRGEQANAATKYFNPALSATRGLVNEVVANQQTLNAFLRNAARTTGALASRRVDLANLVSNTNTTAAAIGDENESFNQALALLPGTLRKANTTFVNLRATLDDLDVLVAASKPATKDLARFLSQLRPLVQEARPTISDLNTLVHRSGPQQRPHRPAGQGAGAREGRQAVVRALDHGAAAGHARHQVHPALHAGLRRLAARLRRGQRELRRQRPLLAGLADLQRLLVQPEHEPADAGRRPASGSAGLQTNQIRRCPGAASQAPVDGSAPFRDADGSLDCDPSLVPPGP